MSLGNLGDLGNLDLGQLQQYLPNLNYPASKEDVVSTAQSNDAPKNRATFGFRSSFSNGWRTPSTAPTRCCRRCRVSSKHSIVHSKSVFGRGT